VIIRVVDDTADYAFLHGFSGDITGDSPHTCGGEPDDFSDSHRYSDRRAHGFLHQAGHAGGNLGTRDVPGNRDNSSVRRCLDV